MESGRVAKRFYHYFHAHYDDRLLSELEMARVRGWIRSLGYKDTLAGKWVDVYFDLVDGVLSLADYEVIQGLPYDSTVGSWVISGTALSVVLSNTETTENQGIPDYTEIYQTRPELAKTWAEAHYAIDALIAEEYLPLNAILLHLWGSTTLEHVSIPTTTAEAIEVLAHSHAVQVRGVDAYYKGKDMVEVLGNERRLVDYAWAISKLLGK